MPDLWPWGSSSQWLRRNRLQQSPTFSAFQAFPSTPSTFSLPPRIRQTACSCCLSLHHPAATSQVSVCVGILVGSCSQSISQACSRFLVEPIRLAARLRTLERSTRQFCRFSCNDTTDSLAPVPFLRLFRQHLHQTLLLGLHISPTKASWTCLSVTRSLRMCRSLSHIALHTDVCSERKVGCFFLSVQLDMCSTPVLTNMLSSLTQACSRVP